MIKAIIGGVPFDSALCALLSAAYATFRYGHDLRISLCNLRFVLPYDYPKHYQCVYSEPLYPSADHLVHNIADRLFAENVLQLFYSILRTCGRSTNAGRYANRSVRTLAKTSLFLF